MIILYIIAVAIVMVKLGIIPGPTIPVDVWLNIPYRLPAISFPELPDIFSAIGPMLLVFLGIPLIFLFAAALLVLAEMR